MLLPVAALAAVAIISASTSVAQAAPAPKFVAGKGAVAASHVSRTNIPKTSTAEAQKAAASFAKFGFSQGYKPLEMTNKKLAATFAGMKKAGATVVRIDLPWQAVQAKNSTTFDFSNVLRVYDAARAKGLKVLPVTSGVPAWETTFNAKYYHDFLYQAGRVLIPRGITSIEVWNEANISGLSPAQYTKYALIPGARGFREAGLEKHKTVTVVSTGLAPAATGNGFYSPLDFLKGIYAAGGRSYFDVVGVHPYTWPEDPTVHTQWNFLQRSKELRNVMVAKGDGGKQMWATEFGFPTNTGDRGISETAQASFITKGAKLWKSYPWAGLLIVYSYQDLSTGGDDPENNFGLVRSNGTAKPSLGSMGALMKSK